MPELSQGKLFLYRLIVSQLQQDGFVNIATSLSIATVGQWKILPSDRLSKLISLCAQVVRDTDSESAESKPTQANPQPAGQLTANSTGQLAPPSTEMGAQQSAFYPTLSQILQDRLAQQGEVTKEGNILPIKEEGVTEETSPSKAMIEAALSPSKNMLEGREKGEMSQMALNSIRQLQIQFKIFSSMTEATRQAYLQSQALQKKPFFLGPTQPPSSRPFPLSTPDNLSTPQCPSTLLPFSSSPGVATSSKSTWDSGLDLANVNGRKEDEQSQGDAAKQSIDAMEEIIKQQTSEDPKLKAKLPAALSLSSSLFPSGVLEGSAIQDLIMQRQLKQRRFRDLDCSFVNNMMMKSDVKPDIFTLREDSASAKPATGMSGLSDQLPTSLASQLTAQLSASQLSNQLPSQLPSQLSTSLSNQLPTSQQQQLPASLNSLVPNISGSEQARYECPRCARVFAYEYVLQTHMRQVCPDRSNYKHPCTVCKKRFQNQSSLKRHMIVHTGERKYECDVCHKRFGRSHHLKRHVKIHELEAASYTQHQFPEGQLHDETLQLIYQSLQGAIGKFPMSPSTLDGSYNIGEDMDASNDGDSVDDGESQGDIDMEEGSDVGEINAEDYVEDNDQNHPYSSYSSNPLNSLINSPLMRNTFSNIPLANLPPNLVAKQLKMPTSSSIDITSSRSEPISLPMDLMSSRPLDISAMMRSEAAKLSPMSYLSMANSTNNATSRDTTPLTTSSGSEPIMSVPHLTLSGDVGCETITIEENKTTVEFVDYKRAEEEGERCGSEAVKDTTSLDFSQPLPGTS